MRRVPLLRALASLQVQVLVLVLPQPSQGRGKEWGKGAMRRQLLELERQAVPS